MENELQTSTQSKTGEKSNKNINVTTNNYDDMNISYKVETKEITRLPENKSLRGYIFDK